MGMLSNVPSLRGWDRREEGKEVYFDPEGGVGAFWLEGEKGGRLEWGDLGNKEIILTDS